jgi:1-acyl-sn-glycerol-3-phosphate acyltransferase
MDSVVDLHAVDRGAVPPVSHRLLGLFSIYLDFYFRRNFTAVRTSVTGSKPSEIDGPLVIYANHPSWWDPIHFFVIKRSELPDRDIYGPMDAQALEEYGFFKRLGVFGVERGTRRGQAAFLRTSEAVMRKPDASLWITAEGEFSDPRQRPIRLMKGIAHLARRSKGTTFVPLAVEYPFWNERRPEALSRLGRPVHVEDGSTGSIDEWLETLTDALQESQDALAAEAGSRDPGRFKTLISGKVGVGGIYDLWRRARAISSGRRFTAAHGEVEP